MFTLAALLISFAAPSQPLLSAEDAKFLEEITRAAVDASRVEPGAKVGNVGPNITGGTLIRPGGRDCYPAFWIRDYAMSLDSGLVPDSIQRHALLLTAQHQQDTPWQLPSGSFVPPGSIPDHISFGNKPIFYPGTLEDYEGQGGPNWGYLPALDDHYFFIHMAYNYVRTTNDLEILRQDVRGASLIDRLERAFAAPPARDDTGLVYADEDKRGVTFGFVDTVTHTGDLLFCSLLKWQAAREMAFLMNRLQEAQGRQRYVDSADRLRPAIIKTFADPSGYLRASTGKSAQFDVWGAAYAVYIGVLDEQPERAACEALARSYFNGEIACRGNIRHVPTSGDFSPGTAWEQALAKKNTYQNGAYWGTPTGWVAYAINKVDPAAARKLAAEFVAELRDGDFRKDKNHGSPWECFHPENDHRQNPVYMTSVTCPLAAFRRILTGLQD
ncbi:MAG: hypothetical protein NTZ09_11550 [Candidatus Hydrogenedentes bacterium]|nr:hypothetical protein [Candidatus Hydrogenedentota bacterium]